METVCRSCKLGCQPLIKAAFSGHEECILSLVKAEADVNERDSYHNTALINATQKELDKCVQELIKAGADVNASEFEDFTSLVAR